MVFGSLIYHNKDKNNVAVQEEAKMPCVSVLLCDGIWFVFGFITPPIVRWMNIYFEQISYTNMSRQAQASYLRGWRYTCCLNANIGYLKYVCILLHISPYIDWLIHLIRFVIWWNVHPLSIKTLLQVLTFLTQKINTLNITNIFTYLHVSLKWRSSVFRCKYDIESATGASNVLCKIQTVSEATE